MPARTAHRTPVAVALAGLAIGLGSPSPARAGDAARVEAGCGRGATAELRLSARHGAIRVEFEVDSRRRGERWRVVVVHERRVVWRGRARTRSGSRSFRIRRRVRDLDGADQVAVRASGPAGNSCDATAVLTES